MNAEGESETKRRPKGRYTRRTRGWDRFWRWERPVPYLRDGAMQVTLNWENWNPKDGMPTIELRAEVGSRRQGRRGVDFSEPTAGTLRPGDMAELRERFIEAYMLARQWTDAAIAEAHA